MIVDIYDLTESVIGSAMVIWGLALLINKHIIKSFFETFTNIEKNEILILLTASMFLILGLITVWTHNDWYSLSLIVTLIGWLITIKSSLWLLFPRQLAKISKRFANLILKSWFRFVYGAVTLLIGLLILGKEFFVIGF